MTEVAVVDQAGSVGFVSPSDRRGFELNPQAWTDMNAVRMDEGGVEPGWGYAQFLNVPLTDDAHSLDYMSNTLSDKNFYVVGKDESIEIYYVSVDTGVYTQKKIGPASGIYNGVYDSGDVWTTCHKDGHMVMTNGRDRPQMILQTVLGYDDAEAVPLAGFDTPPSLGQDNYIACKTIIAFRGFLVAGGMTFSSSHAPQMVAWSDRTDTGTLPNSWDYADPATLAGNVTLPADYGDVIALKELRDELMIYCERGAYRMQWVGGQYVFRIVPAYDVVGAINPRSVCTVKGSHIIVTYSDIVRTDGQYPESIANGTVRKELFDQLSPDNHHKIQLIAYPKKSEVLIICPDKQDDKWCGKVLVWNWTTGVWAVRHGLLMRCMANMPKLISAIDPENKAANVSYDEFWRSTQDPPITDGTTEPPPGEQLPDGGDNIDDLPQNQPIDNYSQMAETYGTLLADEGTLYMFGIATKPEEYYPSQALENENSLWQFDALQLQYHYTSDLWKAPFVERRGINLTNDETVQVITAIYPKMEGPGRVLVYVGAVDFIGGQPADIRWDPAILFDPTISYRITCRTAGRRHAIKFEAIRSGAVDDQGNELNIYTPFRLTGYDIEYAQSGRR